MMNILQTLPMASRKPSTSSDALTLHENEEVKAISIVRIPYIFLNNDTNEADTAAEVMIGAKVDNACVISTQSEAEVFIVPWMDQD